MELASAVLKASARAGRLVSSQVSNRAFSGTSTSPALSVARAHTQSMVSRKQAQIGVEVVDVGVFILVPIEHADLGKLLPAYGLAQLEQLQEEQQECLCRRGWC